MTTSTERLRKPKITQEYIRSILRYDKKTGMFFRRKNGKLAGGINDTGHRQIRIDNIKYSAAHLLWIYLYGTFPKEQIDHIDHNPDNNRIENLREVTNAETEEMHHYKKIIKVAFAAYSGVIQTRSG